MATLDLDSTRWSALVRQCIDVTGNRPDAEDAVQDAALAVLRRLPAFDAARTDVDAYLRTAAHHAALRVVTRRPPEAEFAGELATATATLDEVVDERARWVELLRAVTRLPSRQREAVLLFDIAGLDGAQVGRRLGLQPNAVNQLVFRARRSLRAKFAR
ncbi:sigma-70 family RNA polymerase sigma factor [Solirubrobacter sp. CPCC 204708]|uniref:Sigma-70 family RNA polymerase sigma factor n=1 Tax=Solirubrobacter deserti TaxID=2282478 RepID=A0ABT4RQF6_9ACTN|nr:sigma-70 family RNA polymerase sigma factor [Solirubrobacter deserti]MBE2320570.1 sigma-70 family RNA polymerase sigma factor [Solirubrobacter deserti]MDA0140801.1 sigma-70 family RNA polymerase sigma factor [Solirubrobacter deserti]